MSKQKPMTYEECHKMINGIDNKLCNKCWDWHPCTEEYFYKNNKNRMDGFNPYCKECTKKKSTQWKKDNPERFKEIHKGVKDRRREYESEQNKKRIDNGKIKEWRDKNPDKTKRYSENHRNHEITADEWLSCKGYFDNRCAYCGLHIDKHWVRHSGKLKQIDLSKEHVDHEGANDLSNCVPSCRVCNSRKNIHPFHIWYSPSNKNYKNYSEERFIKIQKWLNDDYKKYIAVK